MGLSLGISTIFVKDVFLEAQTLNVEQKWLIYICISYHQVFNFESEEVLSNYQYKQKKKNMKLWINIVIWS